MLPSKRQEIDGQVYKDMDGKVIGFSKFEFQRMWSHTFMAAWRAFAMADLGIPPALEGEKWNLPKAWRMWGACTPGPSKLHTNYRSSDEATTKAQSYLEAKGVDVRSLDL